MDNYGWADLVMQVGYFNFSNPSIIKWFLKLGENVTDSQIIYHRTENRIDLRLGFLSKILFNDGYMWAAYKRLPNGNLESVPGRSDVVWTEG